MPNSFSPISGSNSMLYFPFVRLSMSKFKLYVNLTVLRNPTLKHSGVVFHHKSPARGSLTKWVWLTTSFCWTLVLSTDLVTTHFSTKWIFFFLLSTTTSLNRGWVPQTSRSFHYWQQTPWWDCSHGWQILKKKCK